MSKSVKKKQREAVPNSSAPWISMRSGIIIISITSLGMAVLTTVQAWESKPPLEAILWGLAFGIMIWAIFWGMLLFNRWIGRS